jgi:DNA helicase-2/ATP-dependent DNA helicase PcrA
MIALEEGILPHERSSWDDKELEEERRLCFVGFTRAREELRLNYTNRREFRGAYNSTIYSRFLFEIQNALAAGGSPSAARRERRGLTDYDGIDPEYDDSGKERSAAVSAAKKKGKRKLPEVITAAELERRKNV